MWRSGPVAVVTASRNDITCGFSTRFAIVRPAAVYGSTTRSAPAKKSFFSASSSDAARDDLDVGADVARRERDVEIVGVVVRCGDDAGARGRCLPAGGPRPRSRRPRSGGRRAPCSGDRSSLKSSDDVRHVRGAELLGHAAADAAVAADDEVVAQALDRSLPSPFVENAGQDTAGDRFDDNRAGVRDDRQAAVTRTIETTRAPFVDRNVSSPANVAVTIAR